MPVALSIMAVAAVGGMATGIIGAGASHAATKRQQGAAQYRAKTQSVWNEEQLITDLGKIELDYKIQYNQMLDSATTVYDTQLVSAAYQMRDISSMRSVQKADEKNFEYDKKMMELNRDMGLISATLSNTLSNIGIQRDIDSADAAITSSRYARNNAMVGETFKGVGSVAGSYYKYKHG